MPSIIIQGHAAVTKFRGRYAVGQLYIPKPTEWYWHGTTLYSVLVSPPNTTKTPAESITASEGFWQVEETLTAFSLSPSSAFTYDAGTGVLGLAVAQVKTDLGLGSAAYMTAAGAASTALAAQLVRGDDSRLSSAYAVQSGTNVDMSKAYQTRADWAGSTTPVTGSPMNITTLTNVSLGATVSIDSVSLNNIFLTTNANAAGTASVPGGSTVSITNGAAVVTGVGTNFLTMFGLGDIIQIAGTSYTVGIITSNTSLTVLTNATATVTASTDWKRKAIDSLSGFITYDSDTTGTTTTVNITPVGGAAADYAVTVKQRGGIFVPGVPFTVTIKCVRTPAEGGYVFHVRISPKSV